MKRILHRLASVLPVLAASPAFASGGEHGELHPINWWGSGGHAPPVGWAIVNFVIFIGLLFYFLRKPLKKVFIDRHDTIKRSIVDAEQARVSAQRQYDEYHTKRQGVEAEASELVNKAKTVGAAERERLIAEAKAYASRLQRDSQTTASQEEMRAKLRLQREAVRDALKTAEEALRTQLNDNDKSRLFEQAVAELEMAEAPLGARHRLVQRRDDHGVEGQA